MESGGGRENRGKRWGLGGGQTVGFGAFWCKLVCFELGLETQFGGLSSVWRHLFLRGAASAGCLVAMRYLGGVQDILSLHETGWVRGGRVLG